MEVSESTVRRDLEQLEEQGSAQRIHGGVLYTGSFAQAAALRRPAAGRSGSRRRRSPQRAVELIEDGDTILLDGGSTTYEVARLLVGRPLHVVTNSLPVANLFASDSNSDLVLIGGNICPRTGVARGPYADQMLATVRVRKTIFSVAGINDEGFFNNNLLLVETERAMMRAADEVIVVADSTKFGHQSLTHLCPLDAVQPPGRRRRHHRRVARRRSQRRACDLLIAERVPTDREDIDDETATHEHRPTALTASLIEQIVREIVLDAGRRPAGQAEPGGERLRAARPSDRRGRRDAVRRGPQADA